jgi:hypothetical protein
VSRKPFRASPRAIAVRTTCAAAAAAALLGLAGCDSRPSVAAYVGPDHISTSSLQSAVDHGLDSSAVSQVWGQKQSEYRRQVLDQKIYHAIVERVAEARDVSVPDSEVAELSQQINSQDRTGFEGFLGQQGIAPDRGQGFLRDMILTSEVAIDRGIASVPERYEVGIIEVPDTAAARSVTAALHRDPNSYAAQAARFPGQNTRTKPLQLAAQDLEQLLERDVSDVQAGQTLTVQPSQAPGQTFVVHIFSARHPDLSSLSSIDRTNVMLTIYQSARPKIVKSAHEKIRINPRFGHWDAAKGAVAQTSPPSVRVLAQASSEQ